MFADRPTRLAEEAIPRRVIEEKQQHGDLSLAAAEAKRPSKTGETAARELAWEDKGLRHTSQSELPMIAISI